MLAIIIINYNTPRLTIECLESIILSDSAGIPICIFVVDNGSRSDSWKSFQSWGDECKWPCQFISAGTLLEYARTQNQILFIRSDSNRGFAGGNNVVLSQIERMAVFNYIWLLNSDTVLPDLPISIYIKSLSESSAQVGMMGCTVRYFEPPNDIQSFGGRVSLITGGSRLINTPCCVDNINYISGASMLIRRDFIVKVGLMCEKYFLYYEEADWAIRGSKLGYTIDYTASFYILHKVGGSIGSSARASTRSWLSEYFGLRNMVLFIWTHNKFLIPVPLMVVFLIAVKRFLYGDCKRGLATLKILLNIRLICQSTELIISE